MLEATKEKEREAAEAAETGENHLALGVVSKLGIIGAHARAAVLTAHADSPKSPLSNMVSFKCAVHSTSAWFWHCV